MTGPLHPRKRLGVTGKTEPPKPQEVRPGPGLLTSRGRNGHSFDVDAGDTEHAMGVITTTCTPCTGTFPDFVWGVGEALAVSVSRSGGHATARKIKVYNSVQVSLPAADRPVQLKRIGGLLFVDVKDC